MKKVYLFLLAVSVFFATCKEEPVLIPALKVGNKNVLVEEFTGVKCVNCPDGAAEIENLKAQYKDNLIPVSIHAGFFAKKLAESKYDFKNETGIKMLGFLGEPEGYPSVVINRKPLGMNGKLVVTGQSQWAGLISNEIAEDPKALLNIQNSYTESSRELKVSVNLTIAEVLTGENRLSIMLTESNIIDAQTVPKKGVVTDYVHKHVLRDMLTPFDGVVLTESLTKNTVLKKEFTYKIPDNFKAENCEIIAILHKGTTSKEVLQVTAKGLH